MINQPDGPSAFEFSDEDNTVTQTKTSLNPKDTYLRWIVVALASFLVFGNDYCYDLPQALETPIQEKYKITEVEYNLLYSVYSLPNIVLPFVGGYILDYFGIKVGILLYNVLIISGQSLFTFGCYTDDYRLLIIGRGIFGIGAESLNVAQSMIVTTWFKGRELSTALGISLCICRLGSSLNSFLSPLFYEEFKRLGIVSAIGLIFVVISLCCGLGLIHMDGKYLKGGNYEASEKIEIKDIKSLKVNFWLLYFNAILCFMSFFPFLNIANTYMQRRFNLASTLAGGLLAIPYSVAGLLTPILSNIIDRKGKKATLLILTCFILSYNHFSLAALPNHDGSLAIIMPLVVFGVFFALYTSLLIPCISVIADEKVVGTAMGIIYSGQNTGLAIGPLIVGSILSDSNQIIGQYNDMSIVLGVCSFLAACAAIISWWIDKQYHGGILQKSMKELEHSERKYEIEIANF